MKSTFKMTVCAAKSIAVSSAGLGVVRKAEDIIGRDVVKAAERNQMPNGQLCR